MATIINVLELEELLKHGYDETLNRYSVVHPLDDPGGEGGYREPRADADDGRRKVVAVQSPSLSDLHVRAGAVPRIATRRRRAVVGPFAENHV